MRRYEVMQQCWDHQPLNRPDFSALHDFFDGILKTTKVGYYPISNSENRNVDHAF